MEIEMGGKRSTCPVPRPTTRSAMNVSSVSPLRWETMHPHPAACAILHASMDSVTDPIWLTFRRRQLHAFFSMPCFTLLGFVTRRSSLQTQTHTHTDFKHRHTDHTHKHISNIGTHTYISNIDTHTHITNIETHADKTTKWNTNSDKRSAKHTGECGLNGQPTFLQ